MLNKVSLTCSLVVGQQNFLKLDINEYICQPEFNIVLNCESTALSEYCGTLMSKLEKTTCSEQSKAGTRISARSLTFFQPLKEEKQKRILFFYIYSLHLLCCQVPLLTFLTNNLTFQPIFLYKAEADLTLLAVWTMGL